MLKRKIKILQLILIILGMMCTGIFAQNFNLKALYEVDSDAELSKAVGYDRLSKFLIDTANPKDQTQRINRTQLLDMVIGDMIKEGSAFNFIGKDLNRGDVKLRDTLVRLFQTFNFPADQAAGFIERWASDGPNETIRQTMKDATTRSSTLRLMSEYSLQTSESWTHVLQGMDDIFSGKSRFSVSLLADTVVRSRTVSDQLAKVSIEGIQKGSVLARWNLSLGMVKIMNGYGALARQLEKSDVPQGSWNVEVWRKVAEKIADDPLLRQEYMDRLSIAAPLYEEMRSVLADSIDRDAKESDIFIKGYLSGSIVKGSRYEWVTKNLMRTNPQLKDLQKFYETMQAIRKLARDELGKKVRRNDETGLKWTNFMLWHLTRIGESVVNRTRVGIGRALANDEAIARELARPMTLFGDEFQSIIKGNGAFNYYPGGEVEFRQRVNNGTVDREALLQYSTVIGKIIAQDDYAWRQLITRSTDSGDALFKKIIASALQADPEVLLGWLETIRQNDQLVRKHFIKFLADRKRVKSMKNFDMWIESVGAAIQSRQIIGNNDVSDFRQWFIEFMDLGSAWMAVRLHLELESTKVPFALRDAMENVLVQDQERFWRIFSMLTSANGPSVATLIPNLEFYAKSSYLPQFLLEEISLRNLAAADSIDPVWDIMLDRASPLPKRIVDTIIEGSVSSEIYRLSAMALMAALQKEDAWTKVSSNAAQHLKMQADTPDKVVRKALAEQMSLNGFDALPFIRFALGDATVFEGWRKMLLNSVKYNGQAHVLTDFLQRQQDLQPMWIEAVSRVIAHEPRIMKAVIEALVSRRVGDVQWDSQMTRTRREIIRIILNDRVLFEQLHDKRNEEFREAFAAKMKEKTGLVLRK